MSVMPLDTSGFTLSLMVPSKFPLFLKTGRFLNAKVQGSVQSQTLNVFTEMT